MDRIEEIPENTSETSNIFQRMCSMVAISQTSSYKDSLRELILQILFIFQSENITDATHVLKIINSLSGICVPHHQVTIVLDALLSDGSVHISDIGVFTPSSTITKALGERNFIVNKLELEVLGDWEKELQVTYPDLKINEIRISLQNYLASAFIRHGIQALRLLDPSVDLDHKSSGVLSELLHTAVKNFEEELQPIAKRAISDFLTTAGQSPSRSKYISQLADGAFTFFTLVTEPEIADRFREKLSPLTIFLDTNFLFGILGLTVNPQVEVSTELIRIIDEYKFPFVLKRHIRTDKELINSIMWYEDSFSRRTWSINVSRAVIKSKSGSGVEFKFHQAFLEKGIDVISFFRPFHHPDILLDGKSIRLYEEGLVTEDDQTRIATLIADYTKFLESRNKSKSYSTIAHDMHLLDVVRQMRSNAKSTLDAGALLITCDYSLYAFDWDTSKSMGVLPCTVLPNLFWQILHPYIPSMDDFYLAFAQTFAIPEFRIVNSGAAEACSKMVNILSGYQDFPEQTAMRMLSNDVLLDQLRIAQNDEDFRSIIESEILRENANLVKEKDDLKEKIIREQKEKETIRLQLQEMDNSLKEQRNLSLNAMLNQEEAKKQAFLEEEKRLLNETEFRQKIDKHNQTEETLKDQKSILIAIIVSIILIILFNYIVHQIPWTWLISHPNSIFLQGVTWLLLIGLAFFCFVRKARTIAVIGIIVSIILALLKALNND